MPHTSEEVDEVQLTDALAEYKEKPETYQKSQPKIGLFDYVNAVLVNKNKYDLDEMRGYNPYMTNRALSNYPDTLFLANEMNRYSAIPPTAQFDFYFYAAEKKKRSGGWTKVPKNDDIETIKEAYGYSRTKAEQVLDLITQEQLEIMRSYRGGRTKS